MFDWDDVKYLIAVAQAGSTIAAAKALGVNQSTVQRRLVELERRVGLKLLRRSPTGYTMTESGAALLPSARALGDAARMLEVEVQRLRNELRGVVRLTCPEPVVARLADSGLLSILAERHPQIELQYVISDKYVDLTKGEADIALRSGEPTDEALVGRKIADSIWAVYASASYVQRHGRPQTIDDLQTHAIVGFDGIMANHRTTKWLQDAVPGARIISSNDSVLGVMQAVKAGLGVAPLPTTIADSESGLVQVLPPVPQLQRAWYLLAASEVRQTACVAAVFTLFVEQVDVLRRALMG